MNGKREHEEVEPWLDLLYLDNFLNLLPLFTLRVVGFYGSVCSLMSTQLYLGCGTIKPHDSSWSGGKVVEDEQVCKRHTRNLSQSTRFVYLMQLLVKEGARQSEHCINTRLT